MIDEIFEIAMIIGILLGFGFNIYSNLSKNRAVKAVIFLNLFILFFTLNNLQIIVADYGYISLDFYQRKLLIPFYALIIPFFYTFVAHYLQVEKQIKSFVSIAVFIFGFEIAIRIFFFQFCYTEPYKWLIAKYVQIEEIVNLTFTLFLFLKVVYIFIGQAKLIANIRSYDNMRWLKKFLWFGFVIIVLWIMAVVFNLNKVLNPYIPIYYPLRLSSSLIVVWISYHGFFKVNLLIERVQLRADIQAIDVFPIEISTTTAPSTFNTNDAEFLMIEEFITVNKKYTIADYSLENLCSELNISEKKLAATLKKNTNFGFPDYLNRFRTTEAAKYLTSDEFKNYTIVAIGLECGFNSKSTFYRVFKKHYNMTPTEFRKLNVV